LADDRHPSDPRPDLVTDHRHWREILHNCWHYSEQTREDLYYLMHYIRCGGAEVILTANSYSLKPGEWSDAEWADIRQKHLGPKTEQLVYILKISRIGRMTEADMPFK